MKQNDEPGRKVGYGWSAGTSVHLYSTVRGLEPVIPLDVIMVSVGLITLLTFI